MRRRLKHRSTGFHHILSFLREAIEQKRMLPSCSLTARASSMVRARMTANDSGQILPGEDGEAFPNKPQPSARQSWSGAWLIAGLRFTLSPSYVFVALRRSERVGAIKIMRIAGHSTITVIQEYVHPSPGAMGRAFERLALLIAEKGRQTTGPRYSIRHDGRASVRSLK